MIHPVKISSITPNHIRVAADHFGKLEPPLRNADYENHIELTKS
jgi:hypothetical protein